MNNLKDTINNVIDELNRAKERIAELGDVQSEQGVTDDDMLIYDIENTLEELRSFNDRMEFALICAVYAGGINAETDYEEECDNNAWRKSYLDIASQIELEYEDGYVDSEWAYNVGYEEAKKLFEE